MKMSPYIASCPNCSARLPVEEAQMHQADGQVRCATCNTVFYAPDQLLKGFYTKTKTPGKKGRDELLFFPGDDPQPVRAPAEDVAQEVPYTSETAEEQGIETEAEEFDYSPEHQQQAEYIEEEYYADTHRDAEAGQLREEAELSGNLRRQDTQSTYDVDSEGKPRRSWIWQLGFFVLLASITFTLFVVKFDQWSRMTLLRGIYAQICPMLDCELPRDLVPVSMQVGASGQAQLGPGIYRIKGVVINDAYYTQPMPTIRLEFIDLQNKVHASRDFAAADYAADITSLPPGKSLPFTLEVKLEQPVQFRLVPRFVLVSY